MNTLSSIDGRTYEILRRLGQSKYTSLYLALDNNYHPLLNKKVVIKLFDKPIFETGDNEIEKLQIFDHNNIIKYIEHGKAKICSKEFSTHSVVNYLVMEYAPRGELFEIVSKSGGFSEDLARFYAI